MATASAGGPDYEKLGAFYLGREFDRATGEVRPDPVLYDARDLTTHALCVGMTGSGKTGLCTALLEEAAIDGIPVIAIDPKGDLGNLLLTFPGLRGSDFEPWIDPQEAQRHGEDAKTWADKVAARWRSGLAAWDQTPDRIQRLRDAAEFVLYTPGSRAGRPLQLLASLSAPPAALDAEAFSERCASAAAGLLGLLGIDGDATTSREGVLLANLLQHAWAEGRDLPIAELVRGIHQPPFSTLGVLDLETFFPAKERMALAMRLNALLASPQFQSWLSGEPLDVPRLLWNEAGKPKVSVLSIAHLSEAQRMFFVTTLLQEVLAWVRTQPGTSSLRAILYMDEVFGYFPPVANPPSKQPMLTLLKQARAFGLGCVLATQNPVDLDYKGLSNCGTWFLGRLQTERDKARVLEGLEGAAAAAGHGFSKKEIDELLASLQSRVFLLHNVHEDQPVLLSVRWVMSYLRGPLSRSQIERLAHGDAPAPSAAAAPASTPASPSPPPAASARPVLAGIDERFAPPLLPRRDGERLLYRPQVYARVRLHYASSRPPVDHWRELVLRADASDDATPQTVWEDAAAVAASRAPQLEPEPWQDDAEFVAPAAKIGNAKAWTGLRRALATHLYRTQSLVLFSCSLTDTVSQPGESEGEFRARLRHELREHRDLQMAKLRERFAPKVDRLQERIRRAEQVVERERQQASQTTLGAAVSIGTSLLGALFGRKSRSVSKAATAVRSTARIHKERGDVARAEDNVRALRDELAELERELADALAEVRAEIHEDDVELQQRELTPRKSDTEVAELVMLWTPWALAPSGSARPLLDDA